MSGIILPPGVAGEAKREGNETVKPVELTDEKWPIQVIIQLGPNMPAHEYIVPCGDENEAFSMAWRLFMGQTTRIHRLDALEAVEFKKHQDEMNGFGDTA